MLVGVSGVLALLGQSVELGDDPLALTLLYANLAALVWRASVRFAFTAREYGMAEGLRSIVRIPVANVIAIMAARRALFAYVGTLRGSPVRWDKTEHAAHPARDDEPRTAIGLAA